MEDTKGLADLQKESDNKESSENIVGEVILGKADPRKLTKEEFNKNMDIVFHGAAKKFQYSHEGKYNWEENTFGDSWNDYGKGLYATDNLEQAQNYSQERSKYLDKDKRPSKEVVYSFLPYKARMLDVRDKEDHDSLGILPSNFTKDWVEYLENYLSKDDNFANIDPDNVIILIKEGIKENFLDRLKKSIEENQKIIIRGGFREHGIFLPNMNGLIDEVFRDFMLSKEYDGMIYLEGGEGENKENLTGYVFYNYEVIDTWEGWQKR